MYQNIEQRLPECRIIFHLPGGRPGGSPGGGPGGTADCAGALAAVPGDVSVSFFFFSSSTAFRSPSSSSDSESEFAKRLFRFRLSCNDVSFFLVKRQNDVLVITCFFSGIMGTSVWANCIMQTWSMGPKCSVESWPSVTYGLGKWNLPVFLEASVPSSWPSVTCGLRTWNLPVFLESWAPPSWPSVTCGPGARTRRVSASVSCPSRLRWDRASRRPQIGFYAVLLQKDVVW